MIRPALPADTLHLVSLAESTGLFEPGEADLLLKGVLDDLHEGRLPEGHAADVWIHEADAPAVGWAYFSRDAAANGVWELWWIGVAPERQGSGIGEELLRSVECHVRNGNGRLLLIATSSLPKLERTRHFYTRRGYIECGRVPDFYADGDSKVIFAKHLSPSSPKS